MRRPTVERAMIAEVARDLQLTVTPRLVRKPIESKLESGSGLERTIASSRLVSVGIKKPEHVGLESQPRRHTVPPSVPDSKISEAAVKPNNSLQAHNQAETSKLPSVHVSSRSLDYLTAVLTEAMGPMATIILREQIHSMGESINEFPKSRLPELIDEVTDEIITDAGKSNCKYAMLEGLRRLEGDND
jgi:hypothetical protein